MSSELTKFRSQPCPAELSPILETLEAEHAQEPFRFEDASATVRRAKDIVLDHGFSVSDVYVCVGDIEVRGASLGHHHWLVLRTLGRLVIDPAAPVFDDRFERNLRLHTSGELPLKDLNNYVIHTPFSTRALGEFPRGVNYFGRPVFKANTNS